MTQTAARRAPDRRHLVVTYAYAYRALGETDDASVDLCARHANDADAGRPLGQVRHGQHRGRCAVCAPPQDDE